MVLLYTICVILTTKWQLSPNQNQLLGYVIKKHADFYEVGNTFLNIIDKFQVTNG